MGAIDIVVNLFTAEEIATLARHRFELNKDYRAAIVASNCLETSKSSTGSRRRVSRLLGAPRLKDRTQSKCLRALLMAQGILGSRSGDPSRQDPINAKAW